MDLCLREKNFKHFVMGFFQHTFLDSISTIKTTIKSKNREKVRKKCEKVYKNDVVFTNSFIQGVPKKFLFRVVEKQNKGDVY